VTGIASASEGIVICDRFSPERLADVVVKARGAASLLREPHRASLTQAEKHAARPMEKFRAETFVVVEGPTVVGSFMTLRDALEFRTKGGSRSARIVVDHGDEPPFHRVRTIAMWMPQLVERL